MTIKTKIENYFNFFIEREKLLIENENILELSSVLITDVYSGNSVNLARIGELDLIYEQMVSDATDLDTPSNEIERQIEAINKSMEELAPDIIEFFGITGTSDVIYTLGDGSTYQMTQEESDIVITKV